MNLTVTEAIQARKSVRHYTDQPVAKETIQALLELGQAAPSAWNLQPWRFVVVTQPEYKAKLSEAAFGQPQIASAPVVVVVYTDTKDTLAKGEFLGEKLLAFKGQDYLEGIRGAFTGKSEQEVEAFGAGQSYLALAHLMLAAKEIGLDTVPMLGFNPQKVKEIFNLPAHAQVPALLPIGYAAEAGHERFRFDVDSVTTWL